MEKILKGLTDAGMDPDMPRGSSGKGTTARQRRVTATVGTLKAESDRAGIRTPAIIVVGKVCALSDKLHWAGGQAAWRTSVPADPSPTEYVITCRTAERSGGSGHRDACYPYRGDLPRMSP